MSEVDVRLRFVSSGDPGREEELLRLLARDARAMEVGEVGYLHAPADPEDAKLDLGAVEWVTVVLAAGKGLRDLLRLAADWAARTRREVRVQIDDDVLSLSNATEAQQNKVIEEFFARHGDG